MTAASLGPVVGSCVGSGELEVDLAQEAEPAGIDQGPVIKLERWALRWQRFMWTALT